MSRTKESMILEFTTDELRAEVKRREASAALWNAYIHAPTHTEARRILGFMMFAGVG